MIAELFRFSDDELILKMKYTDLRDLGGEIYYLLNQVADNSKRDFNKCNEMLEVIANGEERSETDS